MNSNVLMPLCPSFQSGLNFFTITCRKPFWINTKLMFVHMVHIMPNRNKYFWDIRTGQAFHGTMQMTMFSKFFYDVVFESFMCIQFTFFWPYVDFLTWIVDTNWQVVDHWTTYPPLLFNVVFEWPLNQAFPKLPIRIAIGRNFGKDKFLVATYKC